MQVNIIDVAREVSGSVRGKSLEDEKISVGKKIEIYFDV